MATTGTKLNSTRFLLRALKNGGFAVVGLAKYLATGQSSSSARMALLDLHCGTNGRFTEWLSPLLQKFRPPRRPRRVSGVLGDFSIEDQDKIARSIARDGYYVFEQKIPAYICDDIERFAAQTPAVPGNELTAEVSDLVLYDSASPISKVYRLRERDSVTNRAVQRLMADPGFLAIAERYLGMLPAFSEVGMWWSPAIRINSNSDAAQEYHFDFNAPPAWLKLFVYLTPVGPDNGPHNYVRGSHRAGNGPRASLLREGYVRISDEKIASAFGPENIISIEGGRGTVFVADTRGFHKGKAPISGHRLLLEFLYAPPFFNDFNEDGAQRKCTVPATMEPVLAEAMAKAPEIYRRYL